MLRIVDTYFEATDFVVLKGKPVLREGLAALPVRLGTRVRHAQPTLPWWALDEGDTLVVHQELRAGERVLELRADFEDAEHAGRFVFGLFDGATTLCEAHTEGAHLLQVNFTIPARVQTQIRLSCGLSSPSGGPKFVGVLARIARNGEEYDG